MTPKEYHRPRIVKGETDKCTITSEDKEGNEKLHCKALQEAKSHSAVNN
jgi:hypothetical protein